MVNYFECVCSPLTSQESILAVDYCIALCDAHKARLITTDSPLKYAAYLCYSHPSYDTAVVPKSLWRSAQTAEGLDLSLKMPQVRCSMVQVRCKHGAKKVG